MALPDYFELFYVQERVQQTNALGDDEWVWRDGAELMGLYVQDSAAEVRAAEARGVTSTGIFVTARDTPVDENSVLRAAVSGMYLRITSIPVNSPSAAISQFKRVNAEKTGAPV